MRVEGSPVQKYVDFLVALKNSLIIAVVTAIGGILLYSALAYLLVDTTRLWHPDATVLKLIALVGLQ